MTVNEYGVIDNNLTIAERLDLLESANERLEGRILELETKIGDWPTDPFKFPEEPQAPDNRCRTCGLDWGGTMGYCCSRTDCPMQSHVGDTIFTPINTGG